MEKHLIENYTKIFIQGIELNELFYKEAVKPIMGKKFPTLSYSAALIGGGSDILGYDNPVSVDHDWGPKLSLFLSEKDYKKYRDEIDNCLKENLSPEFRGFSVNFTDPDWSDGGTRAMALKETGPVNHKIGIFTIKDFFEKHLGFNPYDEPGTLDWLTFTEQALLEVTRGKVYHDGLNELNKIREQLYPLNIPWLSSKFS